MQTITVMTSTRESTAGNRRNQDTVIDPPLRKTPRKNGPAVPAQRSSATNSEAEEGEITDTGTPGTGSKATKDRNKRKLRKARREDNTTGAVDYAIQESELMDDTEALDHLLKVLLDLEKGKNRKSYFLLYDAVGELLLKVYYTNPERYTSPVMIHYPRPDHKPHQVCPDFSWVKVYGSRTNGGDNPDQATEYGPSGKNVSESGTDTNPTGRA